MLVHYILINYGLFNLNNVHSSDFINNLHIIFLSIYSDINLYINKNKKKQDVVYETYDFYWILKKTRQLLISNIYWNLELNKKIYHYMICSCKNLLYIKDSLKRLRINIHMQLNQFITNFFNLFSIFFEVFNSFISFKLVKKLYTLFSDMLYFWYKKKYGKNSKVKLYHHWNDRLFIDYLNNIKISALYIELLKQTNR
uniref:Hypothetical plastid protein n=1 Tax=Gracilaria tenuistipitata var. liui TaxID=285951 RepID=Q6B8P6_GRATL|nr:hypothetical plastid protein [Gracilaria tenuistipitata var. liui]AAT79739.1 hypothetical plastid protein [Gracilaria tenuistipitata var. liui]